MSQAFYSISCNFQLLSDNFNFIFPGIYGPGRREGQNQLCEELNENRERWCLPWVLGGFQPCIFWSWKIGSHCGKSGCYGVLRLYGVPRLCFWEWAPRLPLVPVISLGQVFETPFSRSDRFLFSQNCDDFCPKFKHCLLPRSTSDPHAVYWNWRV